MTAAEPRRIERADAGAILETIATAFFRDPLWSWAFADEARRAEHFRIWWRVFVDAALRDSWSWVTPSCESVALWSAPGREELNDAEMTRLVELVGTLIGGDHGRQVLEVLGGFDDARPKDEPHYYLTIVATHDDHRGGGIGERLLASNLERIDAEHMPAYLESSNPRNLERYMRLGFGPVGEIEVPDGRPPVVTMWRPAR